MASYNRIILVGNLTRDTEYKQLPSGQGICNFNIASSRPVNKQIANATPDVCYIDVVVWGTQADNCRQYLSKGKSVLVEGRLKLDSWDDQNGQKRSKHSIVADRVIFLGTNDSAAKLISDNAEQQPMQDDLPF